MDMLFFFTTYSAVILCLMSWTVAQGEYFIDKQSVNAHRISEIRCMKYLEVEGCCFFLILQCAFCCLSVLRCLSGNNGFLFIPLAQGWGLSQGLCCLPYYLVLSLCFTETWVWRRGENFSMTEISTPSSYSPAPLFFCLSLSIVILNFFPPSFCIFLPAPQRCFLMFTYSLIQSNKLKLYSLQPACFSFSSLTSCFHGRFFSFLSWPAWLLWERKKEKCSTQRKLNDILKMVLLLQQSNGLVCWPGFFLEVLIFERCCREHCVPGEGMFWSCRWVSGAIYNVTHCVNNCLSDLVPKRFTQNLSSVSEHLLRGSKSVNYFLTDHKETQPFWSTLSLL